MKIVFLFFYMIQEQYIQGKGIVRIGFLFSFILLALFIVFGQTHFVYAAAQAATDDSATTFFTAIGRTNNLTIGSVHYSVVVDTANYSRVTITLAGGTHTFKYTLYRGVEKDIDLNGDGSNDVQMFYDGFYNGGPKLDFVDLLAKQATTTTTTTIIKTTASNCSLTVGKVYKSANSSAVYYVDVAHNSDGTINTKIACAKRPFDNSHVFFTYFSSWNDVQKVSADLLDSVSNDVLGFMPWGPKYTPGNGSLVKAVSNPHVYVLLGNKKYWISSGAVLNALHYSFHWIEDVSPELLGQYTTGTAMSNMTYHPNGTLIKYAGSPKVYVLAPASTTTIQTTTTDSYGRQVKKYISNSDVLISRNDRADRIITVSSSEEYTDGGDVGVLKKDDIHAKDIKVEKEKEPVKEKEKESVKASVFKFVKQLSVGDSGKVVTNLQNKLTRLGIYSGPVTGYFGKETKKAVDDLQKDHGLERVGVVGPQTRKILNDN